MNSKLYLFVSFLLLSCTKQDNAVTPAMSAKPQASPVAQIREPKSLVELKRYEELAWTTAAEGVDLFSRDTVKTGPNSTSRVQFKNGSVLIVEEKSTVTITDHKKTETSSQSTVTLPNGKVTGEIDEAGDQRVEMTIRTRGGWVKVVNEDTSGKRTKARFTTTVGDDGQTQVAMETGHAFLVTKEREHPIAPGETLKVAAQANSDEFTNEIPSVSNVEIQQAAHVKERKPETDQFKVLEPTNRHQTNQQSIEVKGVLKGSLKAYLNGKPLSATSGRFSAMADLKPGLNLLIFQVVNTKTNAVTSHNLEVIRK
jgi:hypothetical protein